jgi:hypothetical protein
MLKTSHISASDTSPASAINLKIGGGGNGEEIS